MNKSGLERVFDSNGLVGLKDSAGNIVVPCEYNTILDYDDDGYIRCLKNNIYSTVDFKGNIVLPLDKNLTHLGVFYEGTARAKRDGFWGLVDVKGEDVTGFCYQDIYAHKQYGYYAIHKDGTAGTLKDDGSFKPSGKKKAPKSKFQSIRVYRNDIAPALTWDLKWVFIDRDQNRVNDYSYKAMDPVLRNGIYNVTFEDGNYGAARFDGTPINDDRYCHPLHFENGLSTFEMIHYDDNGKTVTFSNGQPRYDEGVVKADGTYLFPPIYYNVHWNDYKVKDCWYAEDDNYCYLLFTNGTRRVYNKHMAVRGGDWMHYIPEENIHKFIGEADVAGNYRPKLVDEYMIRMISEDLFWRKVMYYVGIYKDSNPLKFCCRDTDAEFDVNKYFNPGTVLRCGADLIATPKLKQSVHKTRFLIASTDFIPVEKSQYYSSTSSDPKIYHKETEDSYVCFQSKDYRSCDDDSPRLSGNVMLHRNSFYLVLDVYAYQGVTQIFLLQIPLGAVKAAERNGFKLNELKSKISIFEEVIELMRREFRCNMSLPVHGYSLSEEWCEKMHHPMGLDTKMKPVKLKPSDENEYGNLLDMYFSIQDFHDVSVWNDSYLTESTGKSIKIVIGDPSKFSENGIIKVPNESVLDIEYENLGSYYEETLAEVEEQKLGSVTFALIPLSTISSLRSIEREAEIALESSYRMIMTRKYSGDVVFCCPTPVEAEIYRKALHKTVYGPKRY